MPNSYPMFRTDGADRRLSQEDAAANVAQSAGGDATPTDAPVEAAFDPSGHTISEVKAYLANHADQREAVLAAEHEGKARTTLIDWLSPTED